MPASLQKSNDTQNKAAKTRTLKANPPPRCPNPDCGNPDILDVDGQKTCINCGAAIPSANIVSEVTFGESASGAAVVQGGLVGQGQRYAKTLGPAFKRGGITDSREATEGTGREEIRKIGTFLNIHNDSLVDRACNIYKLAIAHRFILGRRVRTVAAVCLYVSCRMTGGESTVLLIDFAEAIRENVFHLGEVFQDMRKELYLDPDATSQTVGSIPLIEVENLIQRYCLRLEFGDRAQRVANDAARILRRMKRDWIVAGRQPSGLCGSCIILAARMNNFRRTAREIAYVVKAADITVGKRLEEFKRTDSAALSVDQFRQNALRIKKQHDPPALRERREKALRRKKLYEMRHGPCGNPDQAQRGGLVERQSELRRDAEGFAIPPKPVEVDPTLVEDETTLTQHAIMSTDNRTTPSTSPSPGPRPQARRRRLRKGTENVETNKSVRPEMLILTAQDLVDEEELEREIEEHITDEELLAKFDEVRVQTCAEIASQRAQEVRIAERKRKLEFAENRSMATDFPGTNTHNDDDEESDRSWYDHTNPTFDAYDLSIQNLSNEAENLMSGALPVYSEDAGTANQLASHDNQSPRSSRGTLNVQTAATVPDALPTGANGKKRGRWDIPSDPEISPSEFDDDPEVKYCLLSEADVKVKEKIWVHDNEQWLRAQQQKQLRKAIVEARSPPRRRGSPEGNATRDIVETDEEQGRGKRKKRKRGKMGDGAVVREGGPPQSTAEAVKRMVEKRSKGFSKFIDKGALDEHFQKLYERRRPSDSSIEQTRTGSTEQESQKSVGDGVSANQQRSTAPEESEVEDMEYGVLQEHTVGSSACLSQSSEKSPPKEQQGGESVSDSKKALITVPETGQEIEASDEDEDDNESLDQIAEEYGEEDINMIYDDDDDIGFEGDDDFASE